MKAKTLLIISTALSVFVGTALCAQDAQQKYSLTSPGGIAFADFKGYEDWSVVSSARTDEVLKVIVANPTMIKAYKEGVPGNGKAFPDGSKIVKLRAAGRGTYICPGCQRAPRRAKAKLA